MAKAKIVTKENGLKAKLEKEIEALDKKSKELQIRRSAIIEDLKKQRGGRFPDSGFPDPAKTINQVEVSRLEKELDEVSNEFEKIQKEYEDKKEFIAVQKKIDEAFEITDIIKMFIEANRDDAREVVRYLLTLIFDEIEKNEDLIRRFAKLQAKVHKIKMDELQIAGFSRDEAFRILLSTQINPLVAMQTLSNAMKEAADRSQKPR